METRVKKYKDYRNQIKKEEQNNKRIKKQNLEIEEVKERLKNIDSSLIDNIYNTSPYSYTYFVEPNILDELQELRKFLEFINIENLKKEWNSINSKNNIYENIIKDNGKINFDIFSSDETFKLINNVYLNLKEFRNELYESNSLLKENFNNENNLIHEMKSVSNARDFFSIKKEVKKIRKTNKFLKYIFYSVCAISICLLILLFVFIFI